MNEEQEVFDQLVTTALAGEPSKFEFIRTNEGYRMIKSAARGLKKTIALFQNLTEKAVVLYNLSVTANAQLIDHIILIRQFMACKEFYEEELKIAKSMLSEYRHYLVLGGKLIDAMFGYRRTDQELFDHRKLRL